MDERTEQVPIYRYTITLTDGTDRQVDATGFGHTGPWVQFDDTIGIVRQVRAEHVAEIVRGPQVGTQEVDAL